MLAAGEGLSDVWQTEYCIEQERGYRAEFAAVSVNEKE